MFDVSKQDPSENRCDDPPAHESRRAVGGDSADLLELLTVDDLANVLKVSKSWVYEIAHQVIEHRTHITLGTIVHDDKVSKPSRLPTRGPETALGDHDFVGSSWFARPLGACRAADHPRSRARGRCDSSPNRRRAESACCTAPAALVGWRRSTDRDRRYLRARPSAHGRFSRPRQF